MSWLAIFDEIITRLDWRITERKNKRLRELQRVTRPRAIQRFRDEGIIQERKHGKGN